VPQPFPREFHVGGAGPVIITITSGEPCAQTDRFHIERMKIMTASNVFGLNFLQRVTGGHSAPIVGDYDPQSQTWGGIVTAQGCENECFNCCGNSSRTSYDTAQETTWTTFGATDVTTGTTRPDYESDNARDSGLEDDLAYD
jgi:hypothetical protein